jgi:protein required for attachment to host cells
MKRRTKGMPVMPHRPKLIYLLVDGAHARVVERVAETGAFVTVRRVQGEDRLDEVRAQQQDEKPGRSFESASAARHAVGREDAYRRAKEGFAAGVGAAVDDLLSDRAIEGVVLVAPPRLLQSLRAGLPETTNVVAEVGKDLIKTRDRDLETWLGPIALAAGR